MTTAEFKEAKNKINADTFSRKGTECLARWGFFYTYGKSAHGYEELVRKYFPGAVIIDSGEVWKNFRGGASTANQSHFFVRFTVQIN